MEAASRRLASALLRRGLVRGDRIALLSHNQVEWLQLFFAAARIGVAVVALSPRYREAEIAFMLADSRSKAVFTTREIDDFDFQAMLEGLASTLPALREVLAIDGEACAAMAASPVDDAALDLATAAVHPASTVVDLSSVRLIVTGGSNVDATLLGQLQQRMPAAKIMNLYGLSEASGALVMTTWQCSDDDLMHGIGAPLAIRRSESAQAPRRRLR